MAGELEREAQVWLNKVNGLTKEFSRKERQKILRRSARPLRKAARRFAPVSDKPHNRYNTAKVVKSIRAPKDKGKVAAIYNPGNTRNSIGIITFRGTSSVFVGPRFASSKTIAAAEEEAKVKKRAPEYGARGQPVDAYYAAMIFGSANAFFQKVMKPALRATQSTVLAIIEEQSKMKIEKYKRKNNL